MLGKRLTEMRKSLKLTQEEIAKKLHTTRSTYAQYEVGRRVPEYATLEKMADFFQVSIDYLVGRTDDKISANTENKDPIERLIEYLEVSKLTNEEIIKRLKFKVDNIPLSAEEADDFIEFVRVKRLMKKRLPSSASKVDEP